MSSEADARTRIAERARQFEDAYRANDPARLVESYFAADTYGPTAYPPGQQPVSGRSALIGMFAGMIPEAPAIRLETIELVVSDTVAFEVGRAHLTTVDGTGTSGRFTVCWITTDEGWRAKVDFFAEDGWSD